MSLRITQSQMYGAMNTRMNARLSDLYESNLQSSSQLRINRPSDDPAAAGLLISAYSTVERYGLYSENIGTAKGWLSMADSILSSSNGAVTSILTQIQTLTQQGATGTYTKENREQIGAELRQLFEQLVNLANSSFNGKHIFAGQKTTSPPYHLALGVTSKGIASMATVASSYGSEGMNGVATGSFTGDTQVIVDRVDALGQVTSFRYRTNNGPWQEGAVDPGVPGRLWLASTASDPTKPFLDISSPPAAAPPLTAKVGEIFSITEPAAHGTLDKTTLFQATSTGTAGTATYRYSQDGGATWHDATVTLDPFNSSVAVLSGGGVDIRLNANAAVEAVDLDPNAVNENEDSADGLNGTWIYARPTAIYSGDDDDTQVVLPSGSAVVAQADGFFARDVAVKVLDAAAMPPLFAYSTDDGSTWIEVKGDTSTPAMRVSVPGGFLTLSGAPQDGEIYTIHPHRAAIHMAISDSATVQINLVGKDVFGGYYTDPATGARYAVNGGGADNMFEVIGRIVGYAETGSQQGMQEGLAELKICMEKITTYGAVVGGRGNRLDITKTNIEGRILDEIQNISNMQDVDITELMTRLSQQQIAYNAVLKSSSMIMQMSLVNFL